jgi:hypothetical protein
MANGVTRDANYGGTGLARSYDSSGTSKYVPLIFAKKTLRRFYEKSIYPMVANTDYEGEIKKAGDQVIIRKAPDIAIKNYTIGGTLDYEVPEQANEVLDINKAKAYAFRIDDIDAVASDLALMNLFTENAAKKMEVKIDTDCLLEWSTGADAKNMGSTAGAISGNINLGVTGTPATIDNKGTNSNAVDFLLDMELAIREQNVTEDMWAVVPNWYCSSMKAGKDATGY